MYSGTCDLQTCFLQKPAIYKQKINPHAFSFYIYTPFYENLPSTIYEMDFWSQNVQFYEIFNILLVFRGISAVNRAYMRGLIHIDNR